MCLRMAARASSPACSILWPARDQCPLNSGRDGAARWWQPPIKLGNVHTRRDYVHVQDVAEALFILGSIKIELPFDIFNIGSGREYSVQELVEMCAEVIGEPIEVISLPELQRRVDRLSQLADLAKIQQASGWKPARTLRQALGEVWEETLKKRDTSKYAPV